MLDLGLPGVADRPLDAIRGLFLGAGLAARGRDGDGEGLGIGGLDLLGGVFRGLDLGPVCDSLGGRGVLGDGDGCERGFAVLAIFRPRILAGELARPADRPESALGALLRGDGVVELLLRFRDESLAGGASAGEALVVGLPGRLDLRLCGTSCLPATSCAWLSTTLCFVALE